MEQAIQSVQSFFKRKDVVISAHRYGIDAMGAMAQGLFASLLIGTIIKTLGQQLGLAFLVTAGGYAAAVAGPAMAASIGYALHAPQLVLFSLIAVGGAANELGGAGGPLAVYLIAIIAAEVGKLVSKETKIDILVTPAVTILVEMCIRDRIHSDFERGFIRAQVIAYKDLEDADFNYAAVKAKGLQRTEGKEYVVNDGDVIEFLFNV